MPVKKESISKKGTEEICFTKDQLSGSIKNMERKDLLNAILESGKSYPDREAERLMDQYMKGKVI